jgi:hypothetical protein
LEGELCKIEGEFGSLLLHVRLLVSRFFDSESPLR